MTTSLRAQVASASCWRGGAVAADAAGGGCDHTRRRQALAALLVLFVPCLYLLVGYVFVLPLIVDRRLSMWHAIELSRRPCTALVPTFGLLLAAGMLLFVSGAASGSARDDVAAVHGGDDVAYEDLFGAE